MRVHKTKKIVPIVLLLTVLNIFVACGSDSDDDSTPQQQETQNQDDQGQYESVLTPLNTTVAGTPSGKVTIRIRGDEVKAEVEADGAPSSVVHPQHIHVGRACPSANDDTNRDGHIDYVESLRASGNVLVPLDNNLTTQQGGAFPVANRSGNYSYEETTSLTNMLLDLRATDPFPDDDVSKLSASENLNLAGRVVIIHGVSSTVDLPPTVATTGSSPARTMLPIACGTLLRVPETPEPVPVPVPVPVPTPHCPVETQFSTRLSNELLIAGVRCRGGETTEVIDDDGRTHIYVCGKGQWLVTVDNVNTCSPGGGCTEVGVAPVITSLRKAANSGPPFQCTYNMLPLSPLSLEQREILNDHQVRFFDDFRPRVIPK